MSLFEVLALMGLIMGTFGFAMPWIVSNDILPLPFDIVLFIMLSWVYGRIMICYYKRFFPKLKKMLQGIKDE